MKLDIGTKKLSDLTAENIRQIAIIVGAVPSLEFWKEPAICQFNKTSFSDQIVLSYKSYRKFDMKESSLINFFFNWKKLRWHYTKDFEILGHKSPHYHREANFKVIKYLIAEGYDVPIY